MRYLIFVDEVEEDIRDVLVFVEVDLHILLGVPHGESMLYLLHFAH